MRMIAVVMAEDGDMAELRKKGVCAADFRA